MKCTLMNKNTCILTAEYEPSLGVFTNIYEINNIDFAPIILKNAYNQKEDIKVTKQTTEKEEEQPKKRTSKTRRTKKNNDQGVK